MKRATRIIARAVRRASSETLSGMPATCRKRPWQKIAVIPTLLWRPDWRSVRPGWRWPALHYLLIWTYIRVAAGLASINVDRHRRHLPVTCEEFDHPGPDGLALGVEHQVHADLECVRFVHRLRALHTGDKLHLHSLEVVAHRGPLHSLVVALRAHPSLVTGEGKTVQERADTIGLGRVAGVRNRAAANSVDRLRGPHNP